MHGTGNEEEVEWDDGWSLEIANSSQGRRRGVLVVLRAAVV